MSIYFSILIALILLIVAIPLAKQYQLKGYNVKEFLNNIFEVKYSFRGKNKLAVTKRMFRILLLFCIFEFFIWFLILTYIPYWWLILLDLIVNLVFLPIILTFLHYLLLPIENFIKSFYIFRTKRKLKKFKGVKIAITGSYGKTSTKNILKDLLSVRYKVLATPRNYNTPMGLCKTILEGLKNDTEILIIEMGARHRGDIKELCNMLEPTIGILTSVGAQHLETFGNLDTVMDTKFELCESLKNGTCFFDGYNDNTLSLFKRAECKKHLLGKDAKISEKRISKSGLSFVLNIGETKMALSSKVLGEFMVRNIALASAVATMLGIKEEEIKRQISMLRPTPHRLELISKNGLSIIDDSYNSNFSGFTEALSILRLFKGQKVVITPGLVELGDKQYEFNFKIGKEIAKICDVAIIMNRTNKTALKNGIESIESGIKLLFADTREEQAKLLKDVMKKDTAVLFENDLPDDYV